MTTMTVWRDAEGVVRHIGPAPEVESITDPDTGEMVERRPPLLDWLEANCTASEEEVAVADNGSVAPLAEYRALRKPAYIRRLSKEEKARFEDTTGDVLDILIAELVARGNAVTPEFADMVDTILAIKAEYPKPSD